MRILLLVATLALAACANQGVMPKRVLAPAGFTRTFSWAQADAGGVDLSVSAETYPGDAVLLPARMTFDVDDSIRPWAEWQGLAFVDRPDDVGFERAGSGDFVYGLQQRLSAGGEGAFSPLVSLNFFGIAPHGGPRPARWAGLIEGEEGYYGMLMTEWGDADRSAVLNLGAGAGGRVGDRIAGRNFERAHQVGKSGRVFGSLALTQGFATTGWDLTTEATRVGAELFVLHDPVDDRNIAELELGVSFWYGTNEINVGFRHGLTSDSEDNVFYLGFRVRAFDTLAF